MKKILLVSALLWLGVGCTEKDKDNFGESDSPGELYSPVLAVSESDSPYTGLLEVYSCQPQSSLYVGGYKGTPPIQTSQYAFYIIGQGDVSLAPVPLLLPLGDYNLVYWGVPEAEPTASSALASRPPQVSIGENLDDKFIELWHPTGDTLYRPGYDYVFTVNNVHVGTESLAVPLKRVTSALNIVIQNKNGETLAGSIDSMEAVVSRVPSQLNLYTAEPSGQYVSVGFPLTIASGRTQAQSGTVMLYPTEKKPVVTLILKLKDNTVKRLSFPITSSLPAGTRLTLTVNLNTIFSSPTGGGFEVSDWNEAHETIDPGPIV